MVGKTFRYVVAISCALSVVACDPGEPRDSFVFVGAVPSAVAPDSLRILVDCNAIKEHTDASYTDLDLTITIDPANERRVGDSQAYELVFSKAGCICSIELSTIRDRPGLIKGPDSPDVGLLTNVSRASVISYDLEQIKPGGSGSPDPNTSRHVYFGSNDPRKLDTQDIRGELQVKDVGRTEESFGCPAA